MTRRRRIVAAVVGVVLTLALLAAASLTWLLTTESGLRWAVGQGRAYLPGDVAFDTARGRLAGPLAVTGVRVRTPGATVRIARIDLEWRPLALLTGRVRVTSLAIQGVDVALAAGDGPGPAAPAAALPERLGLPVRLEVEHLALRRLEVTPAAGPVRRLERLSGTLRAGPAGVELRRLEVRAPLGDVDGHVRLASEAPFAIGGRLDWRVRPPGELSAMAGQLTLAGSLAAPEAGLRWSEPTPARMDVRLRPWRERPEWEARVTLPGARMDAWWAGAPALEVAAELQLSGDLAAANATGAVDVAGLPIGPLRAHLDLATDAERLDVRALRLESGRRPGHVDVTGALHYADGGAPRFDLRARWADIGWPLDADQPRAASPAGRVSVRGTPGDYALEGRGTLRIAQLGPEAARLDWHAQGSTGGLARLRADAAWHEAAARVTGDLRWSAPAGAALDVRLEGLDPARLVPGLEGRLAAAAAVELDWQAQPAARVHLRRLDGELGGQAVTGAGRLDYRGGRVALESFRVAAGDARLLASGTAGDTLGVDWSLRIPALASLWPGAAGRIEGSGRVSGRMQAPRVRLELEATGLQLAGARVRSARTAGEVAFAGDTRSALELDATGVALPGISIATLEAALHGTPGEHRLTLRAESDRGTTDIALDGRLHEGRWDARLGRAELVPPLGGRWQLTQPVALTWDDGRLETGRGCWATGRARLCAQGGIDGAGWRLSATAHDVRLATVAAYWRPDLELEGRFGLDVALAGGSGPVTGRARLELGAGTVRGVLDGEATTLLAYDAGVAEVTLAAERVDAVARLPLAGGGRIAVTVGAGRAQSAPLSGRLRVELADLALLGVLVPELGRVEGRLLADLRLDGTRTQPRLSGSAVLEDGRVQVARLGIELTDLAFDVATEGGVLEIRGGARSGDGRLDVDLRLARAADGGWRGEGTIRGEDFTALDTPEARVVVSPTLDWRLAGRRIELDGELLVPAARIEPRDLSGTVQASPDAMVVGPAAKTPREAAWELVAEVSVVLGDRVRIEAFGLEGALRGTLRIEERPGRQAAATGALEVVDGSYTIYRQTLTIERGRVLFDGGPLANPALDIRAVRRPRDVLVGVNVRGTLRQPNAELFSEPPMPESQQLSYLIAGVPMGETSGTQQSAVAAAAGALAGSGGGRRLTSGLGIDEVGVEQGGDGTGASLLLGRYLSPRLYVGYGIGLMEQADSVRMRYELTRNWSLEARSGATSSADLLYSIESDSTAGALRGERSDAAATESP